MHKFVVVLFVVFFFLLGSEFFHTRSKNKWMYLGRNQMLAGKDIFRIVKFITSPLSYTPLGFCLWPGHLTERKKLNVALGN